MNDIHSKLDQPINLLLIEDNFIALRFIEILAKQSGFNYSSTTNGEEALELVKSKTFNLIITDLGLPGISGYQLAQYIREWEQANSSPHTPIIGLTANPLEEVREPCALSGMNNVLSKPINRSILLELINQYVVKIMH